VLPLLLGIGVDSGIHLVHRARLHLDAGDQLLDTSTARAVVVSALTTIASFGTLAFATHLGMASLGQLLTIGVTLTVLCNLIFLPALLTLRRQRASARRDVAERARS
jgi:predicted RND superfamily exporter protein